MTVQTFSLHEAAIQLGLHEVVKDPVRWLTAQIKAGRITARRLGRSWRMTQADIDQALDVFASKSAPPVQLSTRGGPTAASLRRRLAG